MALRRTRVGPEGRSRAAVVLFPGLGAQDSMWQPVLDELATRDGTEVIFGPPLGQRAAAPDGPRSLRAIGGEVAGELAGLGCDRFVLVAHSLGTFLAVDVARRLGDAAAAVVLVNGGLAHAAQLLVHPLQGIRRRPGVAFATAGLTIGVCVPVPGSLRRRAERDDRVARLLFGPFAGRAVAQDRRRRKALVDLLGHPEVARGLIANRHLWERLVEDAATIRAPVEIVSGERDPIVTGASVAEMCARFPTVHAQVVEGGHHVLPLEAPEVVAGVIRSLLAAPQTASTANGTGRR